MPCVLVALILVLTSAAPAMAELPQSHALRSVADDIRAGKITNRDTALREIKVRWMAHALLNPEDRVIRAEHEASWWRWATPIISTATFLFGFACRSFRARWREAVPPEPIDPRTRFAGVHSNSYF